MPDLESLETVLLQDIENENDKCDRCIEIFGISDPTLPSTKASNKREQEGNFKFSES